MLASVKFHLDGPTKWILSRISSVRKLDFPLNPRIICVLQNFDEELAVTLTPNIQECFFPKCPTWPFLYYVGESFS